MGLTIHYNLRLPQIKSATEARAFVSKLQKFAKTLRFKNVSPILPWKRGNDPRIAIMHEFLITDENQPPGGPLYFAKPHEMHFFAINHPGSEAATFGLARYSKTARDMSGNATRPSNLPGWNWHHATKTQYASLSNEGGWPNFFAIHDGICRILDHAQSLGAAVKVEDESKYWEHRDADRLHAEIDRWNAMMAAVAGQFKDYAASRGHAPAQAPILSTHEFERLEAQGQEFLHVTPEIHMIQLPPKRPRKPRPQK